MDAQDVIFNDDYSLDLRVALLRLMQAHGVTSPYTRVLTPTPSNNDVNGSQHGRGGDPVDFTYQDATPDDLMNAATVGYYAYFSNFYGGYTGHYYQGDGNHFGAIVVDPPAYAVDLTV